MVRLNFGGCRPKPGQPCPLCGKPVMAVQGAGILTGFMLRDWIVCGGAPRCGYARLQKSRKNKTADARIRTAPVTQARLSTVAYVAHTKSRHRQA
jgi:ssDNA-binding Zn-finger/Zn-ribbon topoisomerase 1